MSFVGAGGEAIVTVPTGSKLAVGSFGGGTCVVSVGIYSAGKYLFEPTYFLKNQQILTAAAEAETHYHIEASYACDAEYVVGTAPTLTNAPVDEDCGLQNFDYVDKSSTPGDATVNTPRGRAAFAADGSTVTVTCHHVTATSAVFVSLHSGDTTLSTVTITPGDGSFVVTGNAAATATTKFDFFVVN